MPETIDQETGEITYEAARLAPTQQQMRPLASSEVAEVCTAIAKAQGEIEPPSRTKKGKIEGTSRNGREYSYEYSYAPLEEIVRVIQKPLADAGISRQQYLVQRGGGWFIRTILWHVSGQWLSADYPVFAEQMTGQKFAAAVTYAKRQGLCLVLGIAPEDDNDLQEQAEAPPATSQKATRTAPVTKPATSSADIARAIVSRIRSDIKNATNIEQLNRCGIWSVRRDADHKEILAQTGGVDVWNDLVERDARKRVELSGDEGEDQTAGMEIVI